MRLDKFMGQSSIGVKKEVRHYIKSGEVKVNGKVIVEPSYQISETDDIITYKNDIIKHSGNVYYMFHKPAGCVTARKDEFKPTVLDYFREVDCSGLFPVGRLDMDTEGLLLLTNDGEFDHMLMYPRKHVDKTYFFWAFGELNSENICNLEQGISITGDDTLTKPAKVHVECQGTFEELRELMNIEEFLHKKKNLYNQKVVCGYITITEGKKHQVKRMLKAVGCYIVYLKRISIGELTLDENLRKGEFRLLKEEELKLLYSSCEEQSM